MSLAALSAALQVATQGAMLSGPNAGGVYFVMSTLSPTLDPSLASSLVSDQAKTDFATLLRLVTPSSKNVAPPSPGPPVSGVPGSTAVIDRLGSSLNSGGLVGSSQLLGSADTTSLFTACARLGFYLAANPSG